jgi:hypothetical protein
MYVTVTMTQSHRYFRQNIGHDPMLHLRVRKRLSLHLEDTHRTIRKYWSTKNRAALWRELLPVLLFPLPIFIPSSAPHSLIVKSSTLRIVTCRPIAKKQLCKQYNYRCWGTALWTRFPGNERTHNNGRDVFSAVHVGAI